MQELEKEILAISNEEKAKVLSKYFKTGVGEYGEGDIFLGITVPQIRKLAKKYNYFSLKEIEKLLHSKFHEKRELALFILIELFVYIDWGDLLRSKKDCSDHLLPLIYNCSFF